MLELCITVAVLGLALAALVGSIASASSLSDRAAAKTESEAYGRRIAEIIRDPAFPTYLCGIDTLPARYTSKVTDVLTSPDTRNADLSFAVTDVRWTTDLAASGADPYGWSAISCSSGEGSDGQSVVQSNITVVIWVQINVWPTSEPNYMTTVSVVKRGLTS